MKLYFNRIIDHLNINGIKCDCCNFKDESVKVEDFKLWLNKPCPKCGANLLTKKDLNITMIIIAINKWFGWIRTLSFFPPVKVEIKMDGTGKIVIETQHDKKK